MESIFGAGPIALLKGPEATGNHQFFLPFPRINILQDELKSLV